LLVWERLYHSKERPPAGGASGPSLGSYGPMRAAIARLRGQGVTLPIPYLSRSRSAAQLHAGSFGAYEGLAKGSPDSWWKSLKPRSRRSEARLPPVGASIPAIAWAIVTRPCHHHSEAIDVAGGTGYGIRQVHDMSAFGACEGRCGVRSPICLSVYCLALSLHLVCTVDASNAEAGKIHGDRRCLRRIAKLMSDHLEEGIVLG